MNLMCTGTGSVVCAALLSLQACDSASPSLHAERDGAGVRVIESGAPRWTPDEVWSVAPEPLLTLGAVDGAPEVAFLRITGVHRIPDGGLAVVDGGSSQIRFFEADGRFRASMGRRGEGPGEFTGGLLSELHGDSLWLFDQALNRLTVLDTRTRSFRTASLEAENVRLGLAGILPDGSAVLASDLVYAVTPDDSLPPGLQRFDAVYVRVGPTGETLDTLLVAPGSERSLAYGSGTMEMVRPLFARSVSHRVVGGLLFQGSQEAYRIRAHEPGGRSLLEIRRTGVDVALTDEIHRAAVEWRVGSAPASARAGLRARYDDQPRPPTRPAYGQFLTDPDRNLWVEGFSIEGSATDWAVFTGEGSWLGTVTFPDGFRPFHILDDEVLGVWRDELEVEFVRVHALSR